MKQNDYSPVKVIGLTGGVGSGKSLAAHILERDHHAFLLLADEIARDIMEPGQISYREIVEYYGSDVLLPDGHLNRALLSDMVFGKPEELAKLNSFIHPHVNGIIREAVELLKESGDAPYIVVESAILYEVRYQEFCDEVWYIFAKDEVRRERLRNTRGYSDEKIQSIMQSQRSHEEYLALCDAAIDNSGSEEDLCQKINQQLQGDKAELI